MRSGNGCRRSSRNRSSSRSSSRNRSRRRGGRGRRSRGGSGFSCSSRSSGSRNGGSRRFSLRFRRGSGGYRSLLPGNRRRSRCCRSRFGSRCGGRSGVGCFGVGFARRCRRRHRICLRRLGLRMIQVVHFLFQRRARRGLLRGVIRADGNEARSQDDAQTQKEFRFHKFTCLTCSCEHLWGQSCRPRGKIAFGSVACFFEVVPENRGRPGFQGKRLVRPCIGQCPNKRHDCIIGQSGLE